MKQLSYVHMIKP